MPCAGIEKSTRNPKEKHQERERIVYHGVVPKPLNLRVDRSGKATLAEQIRSEIATAIESGVLEPGARLPSWQDLAAQLGVARGTVRAAYEKLRATRLIVASRATDLSCDLVRADSRVHAEASAHLLYLDPRGELELIVAADPETEWSGTDSLWA